MNTTERNIAAAVARRLNVSGGPDGGIGIEMGDPINPGHYRSGGMEAIDVIEAFFPDSFHLGNAFKYIARAGKKGDTIEDLTKARWYVDREIARVKAVRDE